MANVSFITALMSSKFALSTESTPSFLDPNCLPMSMILTVQNFQLSVNSRPALSLSVGIGKCVDVDKACLDFFYRRVRRRMHAEKRRGKPNLRKATAGKATFQRAKKVLFCGPLRKLLCAVCDKTTEFVVPHDLFYQIDKPFLFIKANVS